MFLFVGFFGLPGYAEETQEQQVERLIRELQDSDSDIRSIAAVTLGEIGPEAKDAIPALIQLLQDQDAEGFARANAALVLGQIGEGAEDAMSVLQHTYEHTYLGPVMLVSGQTLHLLPLLLSDLIPMPHSHERTPLHPDPATVVSKQEPHSLHLLL
jgi:HEAT repeat protein